MATRSFLSILDFTPDELAQCLDLAARLREARRQRHALPEAKTLAGRHIGLLFEKPSLRTRVTFTIGVGELGGDVVDIPSDVMHADREPLHDVARNIERWVDGVVIRTFAQGRLTIFTESAPGLRVVNALSDEEHPCQALADMQTLLRPVGLGRRPHHRLRRRRQQRRHLAGARRADAGRARADRRAEGLRAAGRRWSPPPNGSRSAAPS